MPFGESTRPDDRRSWPVRLCRLGAEPPEDLSTITSVAARLAMMWPLALEAWSLAGRELPRYSRRETPLSFRSLGSIANANRSR